MLTLRRAKKPVPVWYWAAGGAFVLLLTTVIIVGAVGERDAPTTSATSAPSERADDGTTTTAAPTTEPIAPSASSTPTPAPVDPPVTTTGLDAGRATTACENEGEAQFPYGFDGHTFLGMINHEMQGDQYFLKFTADVTNAFDAEREVTVECTVMGSNDYPIVISFLAN